MFAYMNALPCAPRVVVLRFDEKIKKLIKRGKIEFCVQKLTFRAVGAPQGGKITLLFRSYQVDLKEKIFIHVSG